MQVSLEQPGGLERRLRVEIPEDALTEKITVRLKSVAKNARIDGFRPGKAPAKVIERQFGERVRQEVVSEVLRESFAEAVGTHQLRPVAEPVIDPVNLERGQGLSYTATFEVFPEISLSAWDSFEFERPECTISEQDIDKMVEVLREQAKTWNPIDRAAVSGDRVILDFVGTLAGESTPFEGGTAQDFPLILGQKRMIEGFEAGLEGAAAGAQRTLSLQFPTEYHKADVAGRDVSFVVTIKEVAEPLLPALDGALFEKFGVTDGSVESFRKEIRENMERERDRALERRFNSHVLQKIREHNALEVPKSLVRMEAMRLLEDMRRSLSMRGIDPSQLDGNDDPSHFEGTATNRVKLGLLVAEIIKQAGLKAQPSKVRARVEAMAASYEQPEALVRWYYDDPRRLQDIEGMCLEEEAIKWVVDQARVKSVPVTFDDLMNPRQTAAEGAIGDE